MREQEVHVDWKMTPAEWQELRAVLNGERSTIGSPYVRRLRAEGKLDARPEITGASFEPEESS